MSLYQTKYADNVDNTVVGHPMGRLQRLQYLNCNRLPYNASSEAKDSIISIWKKYEPYSEVLNYIISLGRFAKSVHDGHSTKIGQVPILKYLTAVIH